MTQDELIQRLQGYEWTDVEFKKAQRGVPDDAYRTVSAFSNTAGGWLVFGVQEGSGSYEVVGVLEVDKVQNDFLSVLRGGQKLNRQIAVSGSLLTHEEKTLIVFHIPEASRREKPVYIRNIHESYIRRGAGDERCTQAEIERFLRDASGTTYDSEVLPELDVETFFEESSVAWYRRILQQIQGNRHAELNDVEFLNEWGFVVESGNSLVVTRAAILLFGKPRYVRQVLPRGIVDYQRLDTPFESWSPERRWDDRVVVEENIITAWQTVVEKYMRLAERPFSVDATTMRRHDDPPDYISFREAVINLLIHQDYGDHTRKPVIKIFADRVVFWNPGDAFVTVDELLNPTEKEVRNPAIVNAFRRIGLSDQAGTGMRSIVRNWRQLGYVPPVITNDKAEKTFQILMLKRALFTERQRLFQAQLGVTLSDQEAAVFAFACETRNIGLTDVRRVINGSRLDAQGVVERLVVQRLLAVVGADACWAVAEHLRERYGASDQPTDQPPPSEGTKVTDQPGSEAASLVTPRLTKLSDTQRQVLRLCEVPRKQADLMRELGLSHRTFFQRKHLGPLLAAGLVRMTHPDEPHHPDQSYVIAEAALDLLRAWLDQDAEGTK